VIFWRRRRRNPERAEDELDEHGEEIARDLAQRGAHDLDERSGFFGRLERRLVPRREDHRRGS
jgi:hypothetical protein